MKGVGRNPKGDGKKKGGLKVLQFARWTESGVNFVCRLKNNAKHEIQEVIFEKKLGKGEFGVYKVEHIHLKYKETEEVTEEGKKKSKKVKKIKTLCSRLVWYKDEQGRNYEFITKPIPTDY